MFLEKAVERFNIVRKAKKTTDTHKSRGVIAEDKKDNDSLTLQELLLEMTQLQNEEAVVLNPLSDKQKEDKRTIKKKDIAKVVNNRKLGLLSLNSEHLSEKQDDSNVHNISTEVEDVDDENKELIDDAPFVKYDEGAELFHKQQYKQMLESYASFLAGYLKGSKYRELKADVVSYNNGTKKEDQETTEVQMLKFDEKMDYVRATVVNSILGTGANYVDPNTKDSWELWRVFQHNQIMTFFYTSQWKH